MPFQLADYQAGQMLRFGPLSVDRNGIAAHDRMLPWEQVADISLVKERHLVIQKMGEPPEVWLKLPAFKIPNLSILLALFQHIRLTSWAGIISLLVIDTILLTFMIVFGTIVLTMFKEIRGFFSGPLIELALISPFLILSATIAAIHRLQQIHNSIYTFERGMILKRGQQAPIVWRWEEVETVWRVPPFTLNRNQRQQSTQPQNLYAYTIQLHGSAKYTLTKHNIKQETLGKLIKEQVVPLQLPAAVEAYQAGQTLTFGQVQANQQGIAVGVRLLPWSQVKSVSLQGNRLVIYDITQRKPWWKLPEKRVSNLFLLFALADYARSVTR